MSWIEQSFQSFQTVTYEEESQKIYAYLSSLPLRRILRPPKRYQKVVASKAKPITTLKGCILLPTLPQRTRLFLRLLEAWVYRNSPFTISSTSSRKSLDFGSQLDLGTSRSYLAAHHWPTAISNHHQLKTPYAIYLAPSFKVVQDIDLSICIYFTDWPNEFEKRYPGLFCYLSCSYDDGWSGCDRKSG